MATSKQQLSTRSAGVRRLLQEASELAGDDGDGCYEAAPLEDDLFLWHFTIKGPGGDFQEGVYHGRIVLPAEYPFKPPEIYMLTPSGRFEVNKKICLSISSFHPETWQPSWGIRTALVALSAFFSSEAKGAVGSLDAPPHVRRQLAKSSHSYTCINCGFDASKSAFLSLSTRKGGNDRDSQAAIEESEEAEEEVTPSPSQSPPPAGLPNELVSAEATAAIFSPNRSSVGLPSPTSLHHHAEAPGANGHLHHRAHVHHHGNQNPLPPSVSDSNPLHHHNQHHRQHHLGPPETLAAAPAAQQLPVLPHHLMGSQRDVQGRRAASSYHQQLGGPPLWNDRAILTVLLALLAMIVRKFA